jgi:Ca-activated chloride channel family protein
MITIAKDVKLQVQFNPAEVAWYRLLGYENRALGPGGFDDDEVDGGEVGAGHSVTALYELVPAGAPGKALSGPGWKSVEPAQTWCGNHGDVVAIIDLRYKPPEGARSAIEHFTARDGGMLFEQSSPDHQFAASVAAFGMLLRGSAYSGDATYAAIQEMAEAGLMDDPYGLREEFIDLAGIANQRFGP